MMILCLCYAELQGLRKRQVAVAVTTAVASAKFRRGSQKGLVVPDVSAGQKHAAKLEEEEQEQEEEEEEGRKGKGAEQENDEDRDELRAALAKERKRREELEAKLKNVFSRIEALEVKSSGDVNTLSLR